MIALPSERVVQRNIIAGLRAHGFAVVHIPNGGEYKGTEQERIRRAIAKRMDGEVAGFPDLAVLSRQKRHGHASTGWLEVKSAKGKVSERQEQCHAALAEDGHKVAVVRSLDDAICALQQWGWL